MFNINKAIKDSNLSKAAVLRLQKEVKGDYPNDPLLYELHMIRALNVYAVRTAGRGHRLATSTG